MDSSTNSKITLPNNLNSKSDPSRLAEQPDEKKALELVRGILCDICEGTFDHKKQFDLHFATAHEHRSLVYKCILCSKIFPKYKTFNDHFYRHGKCFFRCDQCQKKFYHRAYVLHKQTFHTTSSREASQRHPCSQCSRDFDSFTRLAQHLRHCNGDQPYSCTICNKKFTKKSFLLRHLPYHSEVRNFDCKLCNRSFKTKRSLVVHSMLHRQSRTLNYECNHCQKKFLTSTKLNLHMIIHSKDRLYRCDHCDIAFTDNRSRIKHLRQHITWKEDPCGHRNLVLIGKFMQNKPQKGHADSDNQLDDKELTCEPEDHIEIHGTLHTADGLNQFGCEYCKKRFLYRRSWLRHMTRRHIKYKYRCNTCDESVVCSNPVDFMCDYCGKGFSRKPSLIRHIFNMHLQCNHHCKICTKSFICLKDLESHLDKHNAPTKTKEVTRIASMVAVTSLKKKHLVKEFSCQYCQKEFTYRRSCMRHMKREHDHTIVKKSKIVPTVKEFSCQYCQKEFTDRRSFMRHMKREHDHTIVKKSKIVPTVKDLSCQYCQQEFTNRKSCMRHMKRKHDHTIVKKSMIVPTVVSNEKSMIIHSENSGNTPVSYESNTTSTLLYLPYIVLTLPDEGRSKAEPAVEVSSCTTERSFASTVTSTPISDTSVEHNTEKTEELDEELLNLLGTILDDNSGADCQGIEEGVKCSESSERSPLHIAPFGNSDGSNTLDSQQNDLDSQQLNPDSIQLDPSFFKEALNVTEDSQRAVALASVTISNTLESIDNIFVSSKSDLREYAQDFDICNDEYSKVWNTTQSDQQFPDLLGLSDDMAMPHIDPRLTMIDSGYDERLIENIFPEPIETESSSDDLNDLITVDKLHNLLNVIQDEDTDPSMSSSEFISEPTDATVAYDDHINNINPTLYTDFEDVATQSENLYEVDSNIVNNRVTYSCIESIGQKNYNNNIVSNFTFEEENHTDSATKAAVIADIKSYYNLIDGCQPYKQRSSTRIDAAAR